MIVTACATRARPVLPLSLKLEFGGEEHTAFDVRSSATTRMRAFSHLQPLRDRRETVDFTTHVRVLETDAEDKMYSSLVTTTAKDGTASLREMAYPEKDESIEYITRANGEILMAGHYPKQSVFYIPSLPMPAGEVQVGDTWEMNHEWLSGPDHFPLRIEVVGILKNIVSCLDGRVCADVEVSGHVVLMAPPDRPGARFDSRVRGRALFDTKRGDVVWTQMLSREEIGLGPEVSLVESCLISRIIDGNDVRLSCEPEFDSKIDVPSI